MISTLRIFAVRTAVLLLLAWTDGLLANDAESNQKFQQALELSKNKNYYDAAKAFLDAEFLADTVSLKAAAVKEAMACYRQINLAFREFECIEKLLSSYPTLIDFPAMIEREYELGDLFFNGHRDPAYWPLRWVPWLKGPDRSKEIYAKAIERAPFATHSPIARIRLAALLIDQGKPLEALPQLRNVIEKYPTSPVEKYAYLELGTALFDLSQRGDGDGKYNAECVKVLTEFIRKYPKASERDWAEKLILKSKDIAAERLLHVAQFYNRIGRTEPAERYLNDVMKKYPDTNAAGNSEEMLASLDKTYTPEAFRPEVQPRIQTFPNIGIPPEKSEVLVVPENSNGKWLLPIRDLGLDKVRAYREQKEKK